MREDANAEEDAALGAYRDRLVVELAQNAADAASAADVPGRLLLRLLDDPAGGPGTLMAANTGAPLTAAGVAGLSTLRASAKADGGAGPSVGRFGVGFAAVLAVTDEPALRSHDGAVRFSRKDSAGEVRVRCTAGAVAELDDRGGHVAALRLPFPAPAAAAVPAGYDTVVELPLRDTAARDVVRTQLAELADGGADVLLLALPGLAEVVVERPGVDPVRTADVADRWHVVRRQGRLDAADVADRGVEDRRRLGWQLTWALPTAPGVRSPGVLCAPTPTDEDLPWRAVLVGSFPLGPDRRRVAPGRAAEVLFDAAAAAYGDLLAEVAADGGDALALVPDGAAAGRVDAELRQRVLDRARDVPLLLCVERVDGAPLPVRPSSAVALTGAGADDPQLLAALAPALAGLVPAPRGVDRLLTALGVTRLGLAEVLDVLPGQDVAGTRALFAALAPLAAADPVAREGMSGLPVPLLDGRRVHGARGLALLDDTSPLDPDAAELLGQHGLRVVDPAVVEGPGRDLLVRLGAREGGPWALLTDPAVRAAVAASPDADDPDAVADAVLSLVHAVVHPGGDGGEDPDGDEVDASAVDRVAHGLPWLSDLALPDDADELAPAGALVVPGSLAARALDPDEVAPVHPDLLRAWGSGVLRAAGVLTGPAVVLLPELDLADVAEAADLGLADVGQYVEEVWSDVLDEPLTGTVVERVLAVRDLDLVVAAWPEVITALAADPAGTQALTAPWTLGGHRRTSLTAWWLRRHGPCTDVWRDPAGTAPHWLPPAPPELVALPVPVRRALGVLDDLATAGVADLEELLRRSAWAVGRADGPMPVDLLALWSALGRAAAETADLDVPRLAALAADGTAVAAAAADVVVPDDPAWAQRADLGPRLLVPAAHAVRVADLLDLDLASDRADGVLSCPRGTERTVPVAAQALLPGLRPAWTQVPELRCDGAPVGFWVREGGDVVATDPSGAARGLALAAGAWWARSTLTALLGDDAGVAARTLAEELPGLG